MIIIEETSGSYILIFYLLLLIWVERVLSNLAHTPFVLEETYIASVEGFHQGIKYEDDTRAQQIFELWGIKEKSAGREANKSASGFVCWGKPPRKIVWQSREYYDLYFDKLIGILPQEVAMPRKIDEAILDEIRSIYLFWYLKQSD